MVMMRLGMLAALLLLAACGSTPEEGVPLQPPPTGEITAPAKNVPAAVAAFSGTWVGKWTSNQDARLAVQTVARDGAVTGTYSWGDLPGQSRAGSSAIKGKIADGVLTLDSFANGATASFAMQPDGMLAGTYVVNGQTSTGTFSKLQ
jgi:hypothetical protein